MGEIQTFISNYSLVMTYFPGKDEAVLANQVLQFVFVGNTGFRMPFAHWPTKQTSPATMLFTFWKAVHSLLLTGFEVIYCCLDGSSVNRSFVKLHFKGKDPVAEKFTVLNPYTREKFLFIMDPEVSFSRNYCTIRNTTTDNVHSDFQIKILWKSVVCCDKTIDCKSSGFLKDNGNLVFSFLNIFVKNCIWLKNFNHGVSYT